MSMIVGCIAALALLLCVVTADSSLLETHVAPPTRELPFYHVTTMQYLNDPTFVSDAESFALQMQITNFAQIAKIETLSCALYNAQNMTLIAHYNTTTVTPDGKDTTKIVITHPITTTAIHPVVFTHCAIRLDPTDERFGTTPATPAVFTVDLEQTANATQTAFNLHTNVITYTTQFSKTFNNDVIRTAPRLDDTHQPLLLPSEDLAGLESDEVHKAFQHLFDLDLRTAYTRLAWQVAGDSSKHAESLLSNAAGNNAIRLDFLGVGWFTQNTKSPYLARHSASPKQAFCAVNNVIVPAQLDVTALGSAVVINLDKRFDAANLVEQDANFGAHLGDQTDLYKNPFAKVLLASSRYTNSPTYSRGNNTGDDPKDLMDYLTIHCFDFFPLVYSKSTTMLPQNSIFPPTTMRATFGKYTAPTTPDGTAQWVQDASLGVLDVVYNAQTVSPWTRLTHFLAEPMLEASSWEEDWGKFFPPSSVMFQNTKNKNITNFDAISCVATFTSLTTGADEIRRHQKDDPRGESQLDTVSITIPLSFIPATARKVFINRWKSDEHHKIEIPGIDTMTDDEIFSTLDAADLNHHSNSHILISSSLAVMSPEFPVNDLFIIPTWNVTDNALRTTVEINTSDFFAQNEEDDNVALYRNVEHFITIQVFIFGQIINVNAEVGQCLFEYTHSYHMSNTHPSYNVVVSPLPLQYLRQRLAPQSKANATVANPGLTEFEVVYNHEDSPAMDKRDEIHPTPVHLPIGVNVRVANHNEWAKFSTMTTWTLSPRHLRESADAQGHGVETDDDFVNQGYGWSQASWSNYRHATRRLVLTDSNDEPPTTIRGASLFLGYVRPGDGSAASPEHTFVKTTMRPELSEEDVEFIFNHTAWLVVSKATQYNKLDGFEQSVVALTPFNHRQRQAVPSTAGHRPLQSELFYGADEEDSDRPEDDSDDDGDHAKTIGKTVLAALLIIVIVVIIGVVVYWIYNNKKNNRPLLSCGKKSTGADMNDPMLDNDQYQILN